MGVQLGMGLRGQKGDRVVTQSRFMKRSTEKQLQDTTSNYSYSMIGPAASNSMLFEQG